ncbi:baseplate J/gp47 family protein, partial [Ottowia sp.]|uniref:baseplate J/gp47 family protein n=1 Tax=Ottowia sp. TaxID=1898956 RepID=UPI003A87639D
MTIDLSTLPAPSVVEALDHERIFAAHKADLLARYPEAAAVIELESEPLTKLMQAHAYRELLYRQRVNEAARAWLLAFATGADLDHKAAFYAVQRQAGETDDRLRARIQLRVRALAGNGTRQAYEYTALTASTQVRAARATQPTP